MPLIGFMNLLTEQKLTRNLKSTDLKIVELLTNEANKKFVRSEANLKNHILNETENNALIKVKTKNNIKLTSDGQRFMDGFWQYSDKVIERGLKLIG